METELQLDLLRLKAERVAKGYSQTEMAKRLGYKDRATYAKRENGFVPMGANELAKIGQILGFGIDELGIFFKTIVPERER